MSTETQKLDAAEYVIGSMSPVERRAFEALMAHDEETRRNVAWWEAAFGRLNATVPPEAPSRKLWNRIERALPAGATSSVGKTPSDGEDADAQSISEIAEEKRSPAPAGISADETEAQDRDADAVAKDAKAGAAVPPAGKAAPSHSTAAQPATMKAADNDNAIHRLKRSRGRWRFAAMAATLAAALFGTWIYNSDMMPRNAEELLAGGRQGQSFVAVVNATGDQPSLVVNVDAKTGVVTVRSLGVETPEGKSLELWYVPQGERPVSVGLVQETAIDLSRVDVENGDLLAISLEPKGGSPTGTATGPVIYTGKLVAAEDTLKKDR